jgi:hypothetical protein
MDGVSALDRVDESYLKDGYGEIYEWVATCQAKWREGMEPGVYITIDETMCFWVGLTSGRLIYLPRKPTPLGVMFKTVCDVDTGMLISMELVEGAEVDAKKEFREEWGATTACTLRLVKDWFGSGRVVIGDAWFGSYKTCVALLQRGLYAVMNLKNNSALFPKALMKTKATVRGDVHHVKVKIPGQQAPNEVYGSIHKDVQPMTLVHTTGMSVPGPVRVRKWRKFKDGRILRNTYTLDQPEVHSIYRGKFSTVDVFNKLALGPNSV